VSQRAHGVYMTVVIVGGLLINLLLIALLGGTAGG
jgi:hypothetical protein